MLTKRTSLVGVLAASLAAGGAAVGQNCISRVDMNTPPPLASTMVGVYDSHRAMIIGVDVQGVSGKVVTWTFNGGGWTQVHPTTAPQASSPTGVGALVFDRRRGETVYCIGSKLWTFNGVDWLQRVSEQTSSIGLFGLAAAFDEARNVVVIFGGDTFGGQTNSTWEWNGATLVERFPANQPPARRLHSMTYDPVRQRVVMFGGQAGSVALNDLWEYDGVNWTQVAFDSPWPDARYAAGMTFDRRRGKAILYGGFRGNGVGPDFWEFDGDGWRHRVVANGDTQVVFQDVLAFFEPTGQTIAATSGMTASLAAPALPAVTGPSSLTVQSGQPAVLSVVSNDSRALSYQWRKNGEIVPGATFQAYLHLSVGEQDAGVYDCIVGLADQADGCVEVVAGPALLSLAPNCPADVTGDGSVNFADLNAVLNSYNSSCD